MQKEIEEILNQLITDLELEEKEYPLIRTIHAISLLKVIRDIIQPSPPVEQTVDAGQLEKIIGDAFDAGNAYQYTISPTKAEYIKQAIELFNNFKS